MALAWGVYAGLWLAIETIWMGSRVARWPAPLRHAYVLLIALVGWAILRSGTPAGAWIVLKAMAGWPALFVLTAHRFVTMDVGMALVAGVLFAGPLVPSISRWRVSLDAAAVSVLLMGAATGVFLWRSGAQLAGAIRPRRSSVP
jgi:alginate O-acetyltransferase complex protein AlgI